MGSRSWKNLCFRQRSFETKLKKDIEAAWHEANDWYFKQTNLTGAEYFNYVTELAKRYGYEFGNAIAGHIVGLSLMNNPMIPMIHV
jgi:hypothetical protein